MEKKKPNNGKNKTVKPVSVAPAPPTPVKVPPLFRKVDWLTFAFTTLVIFIGYYLTLAPEVTLEDSGELATGSYYAGVPHPPGYPTWTMYSWLFTVLLPFKNIAWRVGVSSAVAAALSCGLLAFIVSRGSSMMIEGVEGLKEINRKAESAICVVSGFVAGCLLGFNGFMWSQAIIVEVYCFSVLSLMGVLVCLLRWIYAPHQRRYLYAAMFLFGVSFTNHQTLILACLGIEVAILAADTKVGRNLFVGNSIVYLAGLILKSQGVLATFDNNSLLFTLYNAIGIGSLYVFLWYSVKGKISTRVFLMLGHFLVNALVFYVWFSKYGQPDAGMSDADYTQFMIYLNPVLIGLVYVFCLLTNNAENIFPLHLQDLRREWSPPWAGLVFWVLGACLYFFMPITSMTNPPMNWGYPRTYDGFWHAFSRGQYETTHPTDIFHDPFRLLSQLVMMLEGVVDEFNWVYMLIALIPFLFFLRMQKRERTWVIGITAIYISLTMLLTILLNSNLDRQSQELNRVFYAASHVMIAMGVGYGLTLIAASMATRYAQFREISILGGIAATDFALFTLILASQDLLSNSLDVDTITLQGLGKILCWIIIGVCYVLAKRESLKPERPVIFAVGIVSLIFSFGLTTATLLGNKLSLDGLRDFFHTLAISFNKNQYALPVFAGLIVLGLALTYLVAVCLRRNRAPFALSLALFAIMPAHSVMSHWFANEQRHHWFGYWFGHDMFTPPFDIYPKMTRNAILFGGTDPGRFVPTYMIFCESQIPHKDQPVLDQTFDRRDVYIITQNALADGTYLEYIRAQYFRSAQQDPPFFKEFVTHMLGIVFGENSSIVHGIANLAYNVLDVPLTKFGARVEARRRAEGVYPPKEIYTPSNEDSQQCFNEYYADVARREAHDREYPNEPREIRPGEDVRIVGDKLQVTGQVAVMMINGLLCKVIFDHNPTNDFFVEESFPLDWMYPHETPFGVIMKINRKPLPVLPDDVFQKDHEFWSKYSQRLIGNWITYDTSVKEIADFADKVYLQNNFAGFKGDRKFIRDDDAQKAFSKLRSSIAGIYAWRLGALAGTPTPPEYLPKTEHERQELIKEADFAFKQAFAFCPYSPEVVYRYVNFLLQLNRVDDALLVAETCSKLDPYNDQINNLVNQLSGFKSHPQVESQPQTQNNLQQMEDEARTNPDDFQNIFGLAAFYWRAQQTNRVMDLFDRALTNPHINASDISIIAQFYAQTGNLTQLEAVLEKLAAKLPNEPEPWYDLAALKAMLGKNAEALQNLRTAIDLNNKRLLSNPKASNLVDLARKDRRFDSIRNLPEFQKIIPPG
jgi:tetratricopeptide (TPR) repeat protein